MDETHEVDAADVDWLIGENRRLMAIVARLAEVRTGTDAGRPWKEWIEADPDRVRWLSMCSYEDSATYMIEWSYMDPADAELIRQAVAEEAVR